MTLNFPDPDPPGPRQMHVYGSDGKVMKTITFGQRTDPGFFKKVVADVRAHDTPIKLGLSMSGFGMAGTALCLVAALNLGNPFVFASRRDDWKEELTQLKGAAWDVWLSYFSDIAPNWEGSAIVTFQQYLRFKLIGMFDQLAAIAKDSSSTMNSLYLEVLQYDMSVMALWTTSAPVFQLLMKFASHPVGRVALMAQAGAFLTAAGTAVKQFADVFNNYETQLNDLELKIADLRGAFYLMGSSAYGARELHMDPRVTDITRWRPLGEGGK